MAKRPSLEAIQPATGMLSHRQPQTTQAKGPGRPKGTKDPRGLRVTLTIGIREAELQELEQIADAMGLDPSPSGKANSHAVAVRLLREALGQYRQGKLKLKSTTKTVLE